MKKPANKKPRTPRNATDLLLTAVGAYVAGRGGSVTVAGPISIMTWPGDKKLKYSVVIDCVGIVPDGKTVPAVSFRAL